MVQNPACASPTRTWPFLYIVCFQRPRTRFVSGTDMRFLCSYYSSRKLPRSPTVASLAVVAVYPQMGWRIDGFDLCSVKILLSIMYLYAIVLQNLFFKFHVGIMCIFKSFFKIHSIHNKCCALLEFEDSPNQTIWWLRTSCLLMRRIKFQVPAGRRIRYTTHLPRVWELCPYSTHA